MVDNLVDLQTQNWDDEYAASVTTRLSDIPRS